MKKLFLIIFALLLISLTDAQIGVREVVSQPSQIQPGNRVSLSIVLENIGGNDVKDIAVNLDLSNLPFAPLNSATEQVLDEIREDSSRQVNFKLTVLPEAEPKIYKIPLKISYGNAVKDSLISIDVKSNPRLDMVLESSEVVKIDDNGRAIVKLLNLGLSEIKSLRLTLLQNPDYEILSPNEIYISKIDVEDFETAEFIIIPKTKNPRLIFNIAYNDINNNEYAENKELALNVYTLEEAKKLGLVKKNSTLNIAVTVVVLLLIYFIYRRIKKRKKQ